MEVGVKWWRWTCTSCWTTLSPLSAVKKSLSLTRSWNTPPQISTIKTVWQCSSESCSYLFFGLKKFVFEVVHTWAWMHRNHNRTKTKTQLFNSWSFLRLGVWGPAVCSCACTGVHFWKNQRSVLHHSDTEQLLKEKRCLVWFNLLNF